jgi:hypothetical protein
VLGKLFELEKLLHNEEINYFYTSPSFAKLKRFAKYLAEGQRKSCKSLVSDSKGKSPLEERSGMK